MTSRAEALRQIKQIQIDERERRARYKRFRKDLSDKRARVVASCKAKRKQASERIKAKRAEAMAKLKEWADQERAEVRTVCNAARAALRDARKAGVDEAKEQAEIARAEREQKKAIADSLKSAKRSAAGRRGQEKAAELVEANLGHAGVPDTPLYRRLYQRALRSGIQKRARVSPIEVLSTWMQENPDQLEGFQIEAADADVARVNQGGDIMTRLYDRLEKLETELGKKAPGLRRTVREFGEDVAKLNPFDLERLADAEDNLDELQDDIAAEVPRWKALRDAYCKLYAQAKAAQLDGTDARAVAIAMKEARQSVCSGETTALGAEQSVNVAAQLLKRAASAKPKPRKRATFTDRVAMLATEIKKWNPTLSQHTILADQLAEIVIDEADKRDETEQQQIDRARSYAVSAAAVLQGSTKPHEVEEELRALLLRRLGGTPRKTGRTPTQAEIIETVKHVGGPTGRAPLSVVRTMIGSDRYERAGGNLAKLAAGGKLEIGDDFLALKTPTKRRRKAPTKRPRTPGRGRDRKPPPVLAPKLWKGEGYEAKPMIENAQGSMGAYALGGKRTDPTLRAVAVFTEDNALPWIIRREGSGWVATGARKPYKPKGSRVMLYDAVDPFPDSVRGVSVEQVLTQLGLLSEVPF